MVPDGLIQELELFKEELESVKAALLRYAERERAEILAGAAASLPPRAQLVLALQYQEKLTPKEVAVVLNMSEKSVCQIKRDALKLVNQKIG